MGLRFGERLLAVGEISVVYHAVGAPISLIIAALISAVFVMVSFVIFFLPGQLGAAEAAAASVAAMLGIPAALGLSAALLRRARQLAVCVLGVSFILARRHQGAHRGAVAPEHAR